MRFRSDGGPQFASRQFNQFLKRWGVSGAPSTPHYHQSNGHAEAAVKAMKKLIATTTVKGDLDDENFQRGLLEYLVCSYSPLRYVLKHVQYIRCVTLIMSFNTSEVDNALCCSTKAYDSSVHICCDGVLNWKGSSNACCTSIICTTIIVMKCSVAIGLCPGTAMLRSLSLPQGHRHLLPWTRSRRAEMPLDMHFTTVLI